MEDFFDLVKEIFSIPYDRVEETSRRMACGEIYTDYTDTQYRLVDYDSTTVIFQRIRDNAFAPMTWEEYFQRFER